MKTSCLKRARVAHVDGEAAPVRRSIRSQYRNRHRSTPSLRPAERFTQAPWGDPEPPAGHPLGEFLERW